MRGIALALGLAVACTLASPARVSAQISPLAPAPFVPLLTPPAIAGSPLERGLSSAVRAIEGARTSDPAAAARGAALEFRARQQAAAGDVSGTLASAALARSAALAPLSLEGLAPAVPFSAVEPAPGFANVPLAAGGVALSSDLLAARAAIERAADSRHDSALALAKDRYRRALDAYLEGDFARSQRDARAARTLLAPGAPPVRSTKGL